LKLMSPQSKTLVRALTIKINGKRKEGERGREGKKKKKRNDINLISTSHSKFSIQPTKSRFLHQVGAQDSSEGKEREKKEERKEGYSPSDIFWGGGSAQ